MIWLFLEFISDCTFILRNIRISKDSGNIGINSSVFIVVTVVTLVSKRNSVFVSFEH